MPRSIRVGTSFVRKPVTFAVSVAFGPSGPQKVQPLQTITFTQINCQWSLGTGHGMHGLPKCSR